MSIYTRGNATLAALAIAAALTSVAVPLGAATAQVQLPPPCPDCTVRHPCEINPDRCRDKGGPLT